MQEVPIKLYRAPDRLIVAAPMPGLLPEDIRRKRPKVVEEQREMLVDEWTVGSYQRDIQLPMAVDGALATASYGNGVLVVALPLAKRTVPARVNLERVGSGRGERVGSAGHPVEPRSTEEHVHAAHHT